MNQRKQKETMIKNFIKHKKGEIATMKMFIDTANVDHIREANDLGVICGVTTNPSLIAKEGRDFVEVVKEITTKIKRK